MFSNSRQTRSQRRAERQQQARRGAAVANGAIEALLIVEREKRKTESYLKAPDLTQQDIEKMWDPKTYQQSWQNPTDAKSLGSSQQQISIHAFTYGGYEASAVGQRRFALHHPKDCSLYAVYISSHPPQRPEFSGANGVVLFRVVSASFKKLEDGKEVEFAYASTTDVAIKTKEVVGPWLTPLSDGIVLLDVGYTPDSAGAHPSRRVTIRVTPVFATAAMRKTYTKQL